jgi:hypothetical protein
MAETILTLPAGDAKPTAMVEFGGRMIVCYEDLRPLVVMAGPDGATKGYNAGIKPPVTAPSVAAGTASDNVRAGKSWVAYAYYSTHRRVMSELSPEVEFEHGATALTIDGFAQPRDSASTQDIDAILVAVQTATAPGLMCNMTEMLIAVDDGVFTDKSFSFDLSPLQLTVGHNLSRASIFSAVPPAFRLAERLGERVWYAGQASFTREGPFDVRDRTWRGREVSEINEIENLNDSYLYKAVYIAGEFIGFVWDIASADDLILDRRIPVNTYGGTAQFRGANDKLFPSTYHVFHGGNTPTVCAECVCLSNFYSVPEINDEVQPIRGLKRGRGGLVVTLADAVFTMTGASGLDVPQPTFTVVAGARGGVGNRAMARTRDDGVAWLGQMGPVLLEQAAADLADLAGCNRLFQGEEWLDATVIQDAVVCALREFDGILIGNLTVRGVGNHWLVWTRKPQMGFFLMDGQEMTCQPLEYVDDDGRMVVLVGDGFNGRVKRLLVPGVLQDVQLADDTPAAYNWSWRGGWDASQNRRLGAAQSIRIDGLILPGTTAQMALTVWREHFAVRHEDDLTAANIFGKTVDREGMKKDIPFAPGSFRYHSIGVGAASDSGAASGRPMELTRWSVNYEDEGRAQR